MRTLGQGGVMHHRAQAQAGRLYAAPKRVRRRGHVATGANSGSTTARRLLHVGIGALGWVIFAGLWVWQLEVFVPSNWLAGLKALGVMLIVFALVTPAWVAWNRNIYRRRHRRTTALVREVDFERDALGRTIAADPGVRTASGEIVVEVDGDDRTKRYRALTPAR